MKFGEPSIRGDLHAEMGGVLAEAARRIASEARRRAPVVTGRLKRSIKADGDEVRVDSWYASQVEYGSPRNRPKPYVTPAIEQVARRMNERRGD